MKHASFDYALSLFVSFFIATSANAFVVDLQTIPMTIGSDSLSFETNGITVTASGYHAEYISGTDAMPVYGPFTTSEIASTPSFSYPAFGRTTQFGISPTPDTIVTGLMLYTLQDLGQSDNDSFQAGFQPGFDNALCGASTTAPGCTGTVYPSIQFALFSFDTAVNVSQVIVEGVTNFGRAIWAAGGTTAPDLSQDFRTAFDGFDFRSSIDDGSTGLFTHTFTPLQSIQYLAVGTPFDASLVDASADLGDVPRGESLIQFYLEGLNITPVPVPAAVWLFGSGLLGLIGISRRKKAVK
jgi:hypothetical protein